MVYAVFCVYIFWIFPYFRARNGLTVLDITVYYRLKYFLFSAGQAHTDLNPPL